MNRAPDAYAALRRGTDFARAAWRDGASASPRVAGNVLAELDRLLRVLTIDATGRRADPDSRAHADTDRLRALSRSVACLRRHDGRAHHADRRGCGMMTVGWPADARAGLLGCRLGDEIMPSARQMADICAFYDRLARAVMAEPRRASPPHGLAARAA